MISTLKDIREKLLGYRFDTVVRHTSIDAARLREIEAGEAPSIFEIESLARIYGIDAETLAQEPISLVPGDSVELLTSLDEFKNVDDITRVRIVAAANAARDLVILRKLESSEDPRNQFLRERPGLQLARGKKSPHQQGQELARALRKYLGILTDPIDSLRDLVAERFRSLSILYADLGSQGPAGLTFVDPLRGPAIVLNYKGKNTNPCVRRFSLAHELCHLLVDWNGQQPIATISGYFNESALEREQRANAFAVRFLCPPQVLQRLNLDDEDATRKTLARYGLPYAAWRLYVLNNRSRELPKRPPASLTSLGVDAHWTRAEEPAGIEQFPLTEVPVERRTAVAQAAARLYSQGEIGRDEFAEMLGVTPMADLERVLDFFVLDLPDESVSSVG